MPYIEPRRREWLTLAPGEAGDAPGDLNFQITSLVDDYINAHGGVSYTVINEAIGVLECAKLELYRRIAAPYEDEKIVQNGDVYTCRD